MEKNGIFSSTFREFLVLLMCLNPFLCSFVISVECFITNNHFQVEQYGHKLRLVLTNRENTLSKKPKPKLSNSREFHLEQLFRLNHGGVTYEAHGNLTKNATELPVQNGVSFSGKGSESYMEHLLATGIKSPSLAGKPPLEVSERCIGTSSEKGVTVKYILYSNGVYEKFVKQEDGSVKVTSGLDEIPIEMTKVTNGTSSPRNIVKDNRALAGLWRHTCNIFCRTFLPIGFPDSVAPEYLTVQFWNNVQNLSTFLRSVLSTQAILEGMGVGRAGMTSLAATIQWIIRDGASMLGGLFFTSLVSANFSKNVKSWRLFADFVNNIGITLDMIAPVFQKHFLTIICASSVLKAICGVSAGATGTAITEHLSLKNNIAEVGAKNGAQGTATSLFGLVTGIWFAQVANASPFRIWTFYISLTIIHMLTNYQMMRCLALKSLNQARLDVLLKFYLVTGGGVLPRPAVARREALFGAVGFGEKIKIRFGTKLADCFHDADELNWLLHTYRQRRYILNMQKKHGRLGPYLEISIAFHEDADMQDHLAAYFQIFEKLLSSSRDQVLFIDYSSKIT